MKITENIIYEISVTDNNATDTANSMNIFPMIEYGLNLFISSP